MDIFGEYFINKLHTHTVSHPKDRRPLLQSTTLTPTL